MIPAALIPAVLIPAVLAVAGLAAFAAASVVLTVIDLTQRRLPNRIVAASLVVVTVLLTASAACLGDWERIGWTLGGGAALFLLYLVIALINPSGMGGGDVKLAPLIGVALGWVGPAALGAGALLGFVIGALWGITILLRTRKGGTHNGGTRTVPFGPAMILGAWIGIFAGEPLARWLFGGGS